MYKIYKASNCLIKSGKYMYLWLSESEWNEFLSTFFSSNVNEAWNAVMKMCNLFEKTAMYVAEKLGFYYNDTEGKRCMNYLEHVRKLPKDATQIYS